MDRNLLIEDKTEPNRRKKKKNIDVSFLTGYNRHYKSMESIIKKRRPLLQSDKIRNSG